MLVTKINVDGVEYPCRHSMGALLRYKQETGKEFDGQDTESLITYIWCCVMSACHYDKIEFSLSREDFADALDPQEFAAWCTSQQGESAKKGEKKRI